MTKRALLFLLLLGVTACAWVATRQAKKAALPGIDERGRPIRTEQTWIVADITRALRNMAEFAGHARRLSDSPVSVRTESADTRKSFSAFVVDLGLPGEITRIEVKDYLWSPDAYAGLAGQLLGRRASSPRQGPQFHSAALDALTELSVARVLAESERVSALLARDMQSADAHEEAALVVASLVLREGVTELNDIRGLLSRVTAHLAFARALRGGGTPGRAGLVAEVILLSSLCRQRDALRRWEQLEASAASPSDRAWQAALRLHITGDWRDAMPADRATRLEQLHYARALRTRLGAARTLEYFDTIESDAGVEWHRAALMTNFNIEAGHRFATQGLASERRELDQVWQSFHTGAPDPKRIIADLNALPAAGPIVGDGDGLRVQVIDWGTWAACLQRHLLAQTVAVWRHYRNLGLGDEQDGVATASERTLATLRLYPLARRMMVRTQAGYEQSMAPAIRVVQEHPEWAPPAAWVFLAIPQSFVSKPIETPSSAAWFAPTLPVGTAFDATVRGMLRQSPRLVALDELEMMRTMSPHDWWLGWNPIRRKALGAPTMATARDAMGPSAAYDREALRALFDEVRGARPEEYEEVARELCDLDVDSCDRLAGQQLANDRVADAVKTYERWIADSRDRVRVSTGVDWLVHYYHDAGQHTRALDLAQMAGRVYSAVGLQTLGYELDRLGRHEEARRVLQQVLTRYEDERPLGLFYLREAQRTGDAASRARAAALLQAVFPQGFEAASLAQFTAPPEDGVLLNNFTIRAERLGLRRDDVIVAIDAQRVRTGTQYTWLRLAKDGDRLKLIVWRDHTYQELTLRVPQRWFGLSLGDHRPGRPS
jgi:tetratricopeptide (TPR) repeat protein